MFSHASTYALQLHGKTATNRYTSVTSPVYLSFKTLVSWKWPKKYCLKYGFASNKELLAHYVDVFHGEVIAVLHPYQFAIDEERAKSIMEVYDYEWTDEEI